MSRDKWSSRSAFILASIGSAVGLGNAWRFPGLAAKHGGGAFLLVYVVAMLLLGIPLLQMEIALAAEGGARNETGDQRQYGLRPQHGCAPQGRTGQRQDHEGPAAAARA